MLKIAKLSICEKYRYRLGRRWGPGAAVGFIMLNPSTADAEKDDPTIRRCIGFAKSWGFDALEVTNLFAFRATSPVNLFEAEAPVGDRNDYYLLNMAAEVDEIVCAWGSHGDFLGQDMHVRGLLEDFDLQCIKQTTKGQPSHPLYLKADLKLTPYGRYQ